MVLTCGTCIASAQDTGYQPLPASQSSTPHPTWVGNSAVHRSIFRRQLRQERQLLQLLRLRILDTNRFCFEAVWLCRLCIFAHRKITSIHPCDAVACLLFRACLKPAMKRCAGKKVMNRQIKQSKVKHKLLGIFQTSNNAPHTPWDAYGGSRWDLDPCLNRRLSTS